jgi:hypothetical protein
MTVTTVRSSAQLQAACDAATAGDEIRIAGGLYDRQSLLRGRSGQPGRPIVIAAADDHWISGGKRPDPWWGDVPPSQDAPSKPGFDDFALLQFDECSHVVVDGLKVRDCWPSIIFAKDTHHLQIRNCDLRGATYAIFAKSASTSDLLIENNLWQQDESPNHDLWLLLDWERAHGGEGSDGAFRYFNGGFVSTKGIHGRVVIKGNRIMDAFNGIRMKAPDDPVAADSSRTNRDIFIFDNDFVRIRDNPTEPEVSAYNWHVRHNRLVDCHAWFSFDGVTGGLWYFYGNTGYFTSRQGPPNTFGHTMGRVLKLSYQQTPRDIASERTPVLPWFVFNNSWHLRCPIVGGADGTGAEGPDFTSNLTFFNNAFTWCDAAHDGAWVCEPTKMMNNFDLAQCTGIDFDYDITTRDDFVNFFAADGAGEAHGIVARRPIFRDSASGDFRLAEGSQATRSASTRGVAIASEQTAAPRLQADGTLNRGAWQDYGLIEVPALEAQSAAAETAIVA